jgi:NADH:ubiquinone oxidoreductase subunit H
MGPSARASAPGATAPGRIDRAAPILRLLLALGLCLAWLGACVPERAPELLEIHDISPTALEQGARIEVTGSGFPDRRRARVLFTGTVFRPGASPRHVSWRFDAASESTSLLTLPITREVLSRFVGDSPHTTFRGQVIITFPSLHRHAPALTGSRQEVVLDWFGDTAQRRAEEEALAREAERFLAFAGFRVDDTLVVTDVAPEGEAQRSGLRPGDQLIALDGVRLDGPTDLVPQLDGWQSHVTVRREGGDELLPAWDRSAFRPAALADLPGAMAWIGAALALLLVSVGGRARSWAFVEERLATRRGRGVGSLAALGHLMGDPVRLTEELSPPLRLAPYAIVFLVFALLSALAVGHPLVLAWASFPALLLTVLSSLSLAALLLGGKEARGFGLFRGLGAVAGALVAWLPVPLALSGVVFGAGSLEFADLVAGQGELPHEWRAFASPWTLLAFVLLLAACVPREGFRRPWSAEPERLGVAASIGRLLEWFALCLACGLAAALFLGGWGPVPMASPEWSSVGGAALLLAKTWLLLHAVLWWRSLLDQVHRSEVFAGWCRRGVPLAALCFGLEALTAAWRDVEAHAEELRWATLLSLGFVGGFLLLRSARAVLRPPLHVAINPWL